MTDNSAPGVYTQPDGDADDVLGHRFVANDKKADKKAAHDDTDDVEGHRIADRVSAQDDDTDDVEGHIRVRDRIADRVSAQDDDADDVEGHRKL